VVINKVLFKKVIVFMLIICLTSLPFGTIFASKGSDIQGTWAESQITKWMEKGLVSGYPDGDFKPDHSITRAELVALINKSFGFVETEERSFKDVKASDWYYSNLSVANAAGYIQGYSDGSFGPNKKVTRQEIAVIVSKLLALSSSDSANKFSDTAASPLWSKGAIGSVYDKGIMSGYSDNTFHPESFTTRAEAIVILDRSLALTSEASLGNISYDKAGIYGPETGLEKVSQNVVINSPDVTLRNMTITGDLLLAEGIAEGDVFLKNVTVNGITTVRGGGAHSVHFENAKLTSVIIDKKTGTIRVVVEGSTDINNLQIQSAANIETSNGTSIHTVTLSKVLPKDSQISLQGGFNNVVVLAQNIVLGLPQGSIQNLNFNKDANGNKLNNGASILSLIMNASTNVVGTGTIDHAIINASGITMDHAPRNLEVGKDVPSNMSVNIGGVNRVVTTATPAVVTAPNSPVSPGAPDGSVTPTSTPMATPTPEVIPTATPIATPTATPSTAPEETPPVEPTPTAGPSSAPEQFNVNGRIVHADGEELFKEGTLYLNNVDKNVWASYSAKVINGKFGVNLPDGDYEIIKFSDLNSSNQISLFYTFKVSNGISNPRFLDIEIPEGYKGTIKYQDGTSISNGSLSISSPDTNLSTNYIVQIKEGKFTFYLPDGNYVVNNQKNYDNQEQTSLYYKFKIVNGHTEPSQLAIILPPKINGTMVNVEGEAVPYGTLMVHRTDTPDLESYFASVRDGKFSLFLPDGSYQADGLYPTSMFNRISIDYRFTVDNGKTTPNPMAITLPKVYQGMVENADGSNFRDGLITVYKKNADGSDSFYTASIFNGKFSLFLPDGTYQVSGLLSGQEQISINYTFTVSKDQPEQNPLNIIVPKKYKGTIHLEDESETRDGWLDIIRTDSEEPTRYFAIVKNGEFNLYLPEGSYRINTFIDLNQNNSQLSYPITIGKDQTTPSPIRVIIPDVAAPYLQ
jgi:hypothetical protein